MSVMVENPAAYFSQWIGGRSELLRSMESEATGQGIPIVGPLVGRLLYVLARLKKAERILELGTATGYSAIFMGAACRENPGRMISLEIDPEMAARARRNISRAGLADIVEVRCQDALSALAVHDQQVDMIFMDVEKQDYATLLPMVTRKMEPGGLLVADNTGFMDAHRFNEAIHADPSWASVNLWAFLPGHSPNHDGLCIALRQ
jgi:caffeoyl-CoA O-methyltransferase